MAKSERKQKVYTRRKFIKWIGFVTILPLLYLWIRVIKRNDSLEINSELIISLNSISEGFNIFDKVIVVKSGNKLEVFSSSCTHLGCAINRIDKDTLVCPCHGSRYDINGNPVKGPSVKALKKLRFVVNDEGKEIVVKLDS
ncbi:ubiquinol-cytochrome c reductase iron-sulfur subunit [Bacteroidota bacterium]